MTVSPDLTLRAVLNPYLFFSGRCEEALSFYTQAIGAKVGMVLHFDESPESIPPEMLAPGFEKKVMHAMFHIGDTVVFASDGCDDKTSFSGFAISLSLPTIEETDSAFAALAEGGQVTMPLGKTFWSERYGMLTDRFGVNWMVSVIPPQANA